MALIETREYSDGFREPDWSYLTRASSSNSRFTA